VATSGRIIPCNCSNGESKAITLIENSFSFGRTNIVEPGFIAIAYARRHMRTIGYLGQIDKLYGAPATTRNWNTIIAITRVLKSDKGGDSNG